MAQRDAMEPVDVRELEAGHLEDAARVVGRGMRDNPMHRRVFGVDEERRERALVRFFLDLLRLYLARGTILGAFQDGRLVGVCGLRPPGRCQLGMADRLRLLPTVLRVAPGSLMLMLRWSGKWARRDPGRSHWHVGPVAIDRELQGRGVGTALLAEVCRRMDRLGAMSYLETDLAASVTFFERHDFETRAQTTVMGVLNWFMVRSRRSAS